MEPASVVAIIALPLPNKVWAGKLSPTVYPLNVSFAVAKANCQKSAKQITKIASVKTEAIYFFQLKFYIKLAKT